MKGPIALGHIKGFVFDVGETLVNEERAFSLWATWLDVSPLLLFSCLGAVIAQQRDHQECFRLLRPDIDVAQESRKKYEAGLGFHADETDLYPDARVCLETLGALGYRIGIAGNQPLWMEEDLKRIDLIATCVGSSASFGAKKPDPAFFTAVTRMMDLLPNEICYVGDRLDNDVIPAKKAGMQAVLLRRGPWGVIHGAMPEAARSALVITSLEELCRIAVVE
jgi:HAD superfamily hydrolase (TIGR01549 family)